MLGGGGGERRSEEGEEESFEDFRGRAEEGDGTVRGGDQGGFTGFRDRDYVGLFPDGGEVRVLDREIKERSEERGGASTKMLQVNHCHVVGTGGSQ